MHLSGGRSAAFVAFTLAASACQAAGIDQIMASRYLKTQFCIERAVGQRWHERYGIRLVINRWGISEPRLRGWPEGRQNCEELTRVAVEKMRSRTNPDLRDEVQPLADYPAVAQARHQTICR